MSPEAKPHTAGNRLSSFLCWGVVFADIGTSVYYVPGILFGQYGRLAGFFVILTLSIFVLLTIKYTEVTVRFPEGGGVVTVAARAIGPWAGALGGMLILVDYFLTASLSSLSGLTYFEVVWHAVAGWVLWATVGVLVVLGLLNWWGIKESAAVSALFAVIAFVTDLLVIIFVFVRFPLPVIGHTFVAMFSARQLTPTVLITGYAGAFLAFSGLESISQLSPVMRVPRSKVATWAMILVIFTVGITSPLLTVFSTTLLCAHPIVQHTATGRVLVCVTPTGAQVDPNQFISALGGTFGGPWLGILVAIAASALLIFASNTAIIGSYHVFLALTRMHFFPPFIAKHNKIRDTPHWAIIFATGIPIVVLIAVQGAIDLLGDMYAFGLLGAFTLTCLGLDIVRLRERRGALYVGPTEAEEEAELRAQQADDEYARAHMNRAPLFMGQLAAATDALRTVNDRLTASLRSEAVRRVTMPVAAELRRLWPDIKFALGIFTTIAVVIGWLTNIVNKPLATEFGGGVTLIGLAVAWVNHQRMERAGRPAVYPTSNLIRIPNSLLVVLPTGSGEATQRARASLVRAAAEQLGDRTLVFLYMSPTPPPTPSDLMAINDPYTLDVEAQQAFSQAMSIARSVGIPRKRLTFVYRVGPLANVADVWRVIRPEATVALADRGLARTVQPGYVRFQDMDGTRVAFYVHRITPGPSSPTHAGAAWPRTGRDVAAAPGRGAARAGRTTPPLPGSPVSPGNGGPTATPAVATMPGTPPVPPSQTPAPSAPPPPPEARGEPPAAGTTTGEPAPAAQQPAAGAPPEPGSELDTVVPPEALADADRYVWTGTELKRRDELEDDPREGRKQQPAKPREP